MGDRAPVQQVPVGVKAFHCYRQGLPREHIREERQPDYPVLCYREQLTRLALR